MVKAPTARRNNRNSKKGFSHANSRPLRGAAIDLADFSNRYHSNFIVKTRDNSEVADQYLKGLFQANKKNMERMVEAVPNSDDQRYQHFLSNSTWGEDDVIEQVALEANCLIGGKPDSFLLIDETGIPKKGDKSVGVSRQYCGELGKVDNCQVGVFTALGHKDSVVPVDCRLFLPRNWTDDPSRCREAGVPDEHIEFHRKHDLALQMIIMARARGLEYNWIGFDALYGEDPAFLRFLDEIGEVFMGDVHTDQRIYLQDPEPFIPEPKFNRGRKPKSLKAQTDSIRVDQWATQQPEGSWIKIHVGGTTKGILKIEALHRRVWLWDGKELQAKLWHLIVRRDMGTNEIKYSLCNAPEETSIKRLAYMQGQRYLIERVFQDGKNQCGMGQYQARGWRSWYHHMAMVMMAMLFMLDQRLKNSEAYPMLSCNDVVEILSYFLPHRMATEEEVFRQLEERHRRRKKAIESAYNQQKIKEKMAI